jgi:hypothetical protein
MPSSGDDENTRLAVISAKIICGKLHAWLSNYKPKPLYRGVRTQLNPHYFADAKVIVEYAHTGRLIGGSADLVIDITTANGENTHRVVVEFKTTKSATKDHKIQVAAYMEFFKADHGIIIYDDPDIENIHIKKTEQKELFAIFEQKTADYEYGDIYEDSFDAVRINEICHELFDLNSRARDLEKERCALVAKIVDTNQNAQFALNLGVGVVFGDVRLKLVTTNTKKVVDMAFFKEKYPKIYDIIVEENTSSYKKFSLIGGVKNDN